MVSSQVGSNIVGGTKRTPLNFGGGGTGGAVWGLGVKWNASMKAGAGLKRREVDVRG